MFWRVVPFHTLMPLLDPRKQSEKEQGYVYQHVHLTKCLSLNPGSVYFTSFNLHGNSENKDR